MVKEQYKLWCEKATIDPDLVAELNADSEKSACFNIPTSVVIDQPCCSIYSIKAIDAL